MINFNDWHDWQSRGRFSITGIPRFTLLMWGHIKKSGKQNPHNSRLLNSTKGEENRIELQTTLNWKLLKSKPRKLRNAFTYLSTACLVSDKMLKFFLICYNGKKPWKVQWFYFIQNQFFIICSKIVDWKPVVVVSMYKESTSLYFNKAMKKADQ